MDVLNLGNSTAPEISFESSVWLFRLYIAGNAPNSLQAMANLKRIADQFLPGRYEVEIVDVLKEPFRTLEDNIYVTPTLIRLSPTPNCKIIGSLSDMKQVLLALELTETMDG